MSYLIDQKNTKNKNFVDIHSSNIFEDPKIAADKYNGYLINIRPNLAKRLITMIILVYNVYNNIDAKVIKLAIEETSKPLTHIFNVPFTTGIMPNILKLGLITPKYDIKISINNANE